MKSVTQLAASLGTTRQAVLKRIKRGTIKAELVGNSYMIEESEFNRVKELNNLLLVRDKTNQ